VRVVLLEAELGVAVDLVGCVDEGVGVGRDDLVDAVLGSSEVDHRRRLRRPGT
jgi:hypothetical protein